MNAARLAAVTALTLTALAWGAAPPTFAKASAFAL